MRSAKARHLTESDESQTLPRLSERPNALPFTGLSQISFMRNSWGRFDSTLAIVVELGGALALQMVLKHVF